MDGLKPHIHKDVLLVQPTNVSEAMMAAERSEVAHIYQSNSKNKSLFSHQNFQNRQFRPSNANNNQPQRSTQRIFHPREYGNPNTVPMELGYTN